MGIFWWIAWVKNVRFVLNHDLLAFYRSTLREMVEALHELVMEYMH